MLVTATATQMQNNFGHYLGLVIGGEEVVITKNGKEVARMVSRNSAETSIGRSLLGILSDKYNIDEEREKALREKYERID